MKFNHVLSFGRTGEDLLKMFALEETRLAGLRVLDCPGGPGSLSSLLRQRGAFPTAVDPNYGLPPEQLQQQTLHDISVVAEQLPVSEIFREDLNHDEYFKSKFKAYQEFKRDRAAHTSDYVAASLPDLPFPDQSFNLVLSGSLLFSYSPVSDGGLLIAAGLDYEWHLQALQELLRVTETEARIYPAHTQQGASAEVHPYAEDLLAAMAPEWECSFFHSHLDQGIKGQTVGLQFKRKSAV